MAAKTLEDFRAKLSKAYADKRIDRNLLDRIATAMYESRDDPGANYGDFALQEGDLSAFRTPEQQIGIPSKYTGIKDPNKGYHTAGDALDIGPPRLPGETQQQYDNRSAAANAALAKRLGGGVTWGGGWKKPDYSHFQSAMRDPNNNGAGVQIFPAGGQQPIAMETAGPRLSGAGPMSMLNRIDAPTPMRPTGAGPMAGLNRITSTPPEQVPQQAGGLPPDMGTMLQQYTRQGGTGGLGSGPMAGPRSMAQALGIPQGGLKKPQLGILQMLSSMFK